VYRIGENLALVETTDIITPLVDDPFTFGRIAAANALSDVYAMGGRPILALALVGMPLDKLPGEVIGRILEGGASVCRAAGIPIAGGHSIDVLEPIYGLVGLGLVHPEQVKKNAAARAGDTLVLTKPLGIGVLSAALKKGLLSDEGYAEMIRWTTQLNTAGAALAGMEAVHAMTDVTGFGLAGHLLEICRGSGLMARIAVECLPLIREAGEHLQAGIATGASARNWASYGASLEVAPELAEWQKKLVTDPQTSGGLLIACASGAVMEVQAIIEAAQGVRGTVIGRLEAGPAMVHIT